MTDKKKFEVGDRFMWSRNTLRSIGVPQTSPVWKRAGRIWKFSDLGGIAFVEWDDKLGPQTVGVQDIDHEVKS